MQEQLNQDLVTGESGGRPGEGPASAKGEVEGARHSTRRSSYADGKEVVEDMILAAIKKDAQSKAHRARRNRKWARVAEESVGPPT